MKLFGELIFTHEGRTSLLDEGPLEMRPEGLLVPTEVGTSLVPRREVEDLRVVERRLYEPTHNDRKCSAPAAFSATTSARSHQAIRHCDRAAAIPHGCARRAT